MSRPEHVFIAHAVEDGIFAETLAASMSRPGVEVVRDSQIEIGDAWAEGVRREVEQASTVVLVIPSDTAVNRNDVWFEAGAAKALGKRILAIAVSNEREQALPPRFADLTIADGATRPVAGVADMLLRAVRAAADRTSDPYTLLARHAKTKAKAQQ